MTSIRWEREGLVNAEFVPPVRSGFTVHGDWYPGLPGWHFYASGSLERIVPQRVVYVSLERYPSLLFYDHRVSGWRDALRAAESPETPSSERRGVLFVTADDEDFLAYADTDCRSVLASDWVHNLADRYVASWLIQRVCAEMGWHDEYCENEVGNAPTDIELLVGADPEFEVAVCVDNYAVVVHADGYIERSTEPESRVGTDGAGSQLELRPRPARTPEELYEQILALAKRARAWLADLAESDVELLLSGHVLPIGCHIHLGTAQGYTAAEYREFVRTLDRVRTPMGELGELMVRLSGSARGSYATRAACEGGKCHGGFEYRTPPAAILAFPEAFCYVAGVMLALAKGEQLPHFPRREFETLAKLVDRGASFTFGGRTVKCADWVVLASGFSWSQTWRDVVERVRAPVRVTRLFGYRAERGDVTNLPRLARAFGWQLLQEYSEDVGLPWSARASDDAEFVRRIIAEIVT